VANTLQSFQAKLTESFSSKVLLLESLIGGRHWLTTGTFKERVLLSFLNETLPKKLRAKSGFVLFPKSIPPTKVSNNPKLDVLNRSEYVLSKQIDVLVYNPFEFMPVYEDNDIAILPPEALSHVIEVKGVLTYNSINEAISQLEDFCTKWKAYMKFSVKHYVESKPKAPELFIYSWQSRGLNGKYIRERLCKHANRVSTARTYDSLPKIEAVYVFADNATTFCASVENKTSSSGYLTIRGQNIHFNDHGEAEYAGDKTMFSLVRSILYRNGLMTNRFLVDTDETNYENVLAHRHGGYLKAFDDS